jgi:hypothetical protein
MRLIGWDVDIVHWRNNHLVDANYWLCLDCNLCYNPSFHSYLHFFESFCTNHPSPTEILIKAEYMPYYRGPCVHALPSPNDKPIHNDVVSDTAPPIDDAAAALLTSIVTSRELGSTSLGIWLVVFGDFTAANLSLMDPPAQAFYNSELTALAYSITRFGWAVYGLNSGHFIRIETKFATINCWRNIFTIGNS